MVQRARHDLIPYREAIARSGLKRATWYARLKESPEIEVYEDGIDRRLRLIAAEDADRLAAPRPRRRVAA